jgi:hypothetical protein
MVTVRSRLVLLACVAGFPISAIAQEGGSPIQQGSVQVGGTATLNRSRDIGNDFGWVTLDLFPRAGYFVVKGFAVSLNGRHRRIYYDDQALVRDQRFVEWGLGPGVTYYASTKSRRLFPFVSARTLFSRTRNESDIFARPQDTEPAEENRISRSRTATWLISGGVMYMLVKHVGVTSEAYYQHTRSTVQTEPQPESSNRAEQFGLQWGVAAFIF